MTLRWSFIIPAALAHGVSNILIVAGVNMWWGDGRDLRVLFWAIFAYVRWRKWPIEATSCETESEANFPTSLLHLEPKA
jgi:hypothetical protein